MENSLFGLYIDKYIRIYYPLKEFARNAEV